MSQTHYKKSFITLATLNYKSPTIMTSFFDKTFAHLAHQPDTITAVLAATRPIMNSSAVPVMLSDDELWKGLIIAPPSTLRKEENLLLLFSTFCDTMQFTEKLAFDPQRPRVEEKDLNFAKKILSHLVDTKRYFTRTLKSLQITDNSDEMIDIVCRAGFRNLRLLHMDPGCRFKEDHLKKICSSSSLINCSLEELSLKNQRGLFSPPPPPPPHSDESFSSLLPSSPLSNLKAIRKLDLSGSDVPNLYFLKDLPLIQELLISHCSHLTSECFANFFDKTTNNNNDSPPSPLSLVPSLTTIDIRGCYNRKNNPILQIPLRQLRVVAPNLLSLSCSLVPSVRGAVEIAKMDYLQHLEVYKCKYLNEEFCRVLFSNLKHLERVYLHGVSIGDAHLRHIADTDSPIRSLHFAATNFTDEGFAQLMTRKLARYLEKLQIDWNDSPAFTGDIISTTGEGQEMKSFSLSSSPLKELRFSYACHISDKGLASILKLFSSSLEILQLKQCSQLSSLGLQTALSPENSDCYKSLRELEIHGCSKANDLSFLNTEFKNIRKITISTLVNLDFDLVRRRKKQEGALCASIFDDLSSPSPTLEELTISDLRVKAVSAMDMMAFAATVPKSFPNLKHLDVSNCFPQITDQLIKSISSLRFLETLCIQGKYGDSGESDNNRDSDDDNNNNNNKEFTVNRLAALVKSLSRLKKVSMNKNLCELITQDSALFRKFGYLISD